MTYDDAEYLHGNIICTSNISVMVIINIRVEKFSPSPGIEPGSLVLRTKRSHHRATPSPIHSIGSNSPPPVFFPLWSDSKLGTSKTAYTVIVATVRFKNMFAFSSDERAFNIESFSHRILNFQSLMAFVQSLSTAAPSLCNSSPERYVGMTSRAVASWSEASCLELALRNAYWFESSWEKKFSHEISASVWDRYQPSLVMHLGSYDSLEQRSERRNWYYEGTTSDSYFKRYAPACIISSKTAYTVIVATVRSKNMFAFSSDERAFNIESFSHRILNFQSLMAFVQSLSTAAPSQCNSSPERYVGMT
ncbi:hypothetical protein ANN_19912 [Periplaneta americana]|uniref:Uncharacterized protein n=1 Tax=Periplaneta americana TaxID=6978 RepID=A0ABQ8SBV3_PERAM|nr:hypothetical protein ANN_19912 [Periplaneta americana]